MRIVDVKALPIKIPETEFWGGKGDEAPRPDQSSDYVVQPGWIGLYSSKIETCLVRIESEDGTVGYGEGQTPIGPEVTATIVERVLRPLLLGEDAMRVSVLRRRMYEALLVRGHFTGYVVDAIAGVDSALWDLKGKSVGRPVSDLLGGAFRTRIPAYVSGLKGKMVDDQIATGQEYESGDPAGELVQPTGAAAAEEAVEALLAKAGVKGWAAPSKAARFFAALDGTLLD